MSIESVPRVDAQVEEVDPRWEEPARAALSWIFGFGLDRDYDQD